MTDRELIEKILESDGKGLTDLEAARLNAGLSRTDFVSRAIKALPEDSVSMAWRSALNERLLEVSKKKARSKRLDWVLRPALGVGFALAFAVVLFVSPRVVAPPRAMAAQQSVEVQMVQAHQEAVNTMLVAGRGMASYEAKPTLTIPANIVHWEEADLGDF